MTGSAIEQEDDDVFYDLDDFAVTLIYGAPEISLKVLFDRQEIEDDERAAVRPVFRSRTKVSENTEVTILGRQYTVMAVETLETDEHLHILRNAT